MEDLKDFDAAADSFFGDIFKGGTSGAVKFGTGIGKSIAHKKAGDALLAQGMAIEAAKGLEAKSLRKRAQFSKALAQRAAIGETRKGDLVESALIARAAAGGGASDPGVIKLAGDIAAEADFRKRTALAEGDVTAAGLLDAATLRNFEGSEARKAGKRAQKFKRIAAFTTLLGQSEHLSLFDKFGEKKTPKFDPAASFHDFD